MTNAACCAEGFKFIDWADAQTAEDLAIAIGWHFDFCDIAVNISFCPFCGTKLPEVTE